MEEIKFIKKAHMVQIRINRPHKLNAVNLQTVRELRRCLREAGEDEEVKVVSLLGEGGKAFCAGGDIEEMAHFSKEEALNFLKEFAGVVLDIKRLPCVVVAGVDGYCFGGGLEICGACDYVIATPGSTFAQRGLFLGLAPVMGGPQFISRITGERFIKALMFTGDVISCEEAKSFALVNKVVEPERLEEEIEKFASRLRDVPKYAIGVTKQAFFDTYLQAEDLLERAAQALAEIIVSPPTRDKLKHFISKGK